MGMFYFVYVKMNWKGEGFKEEEEEVLMMMVVGGNCSGYYSRYTLPDGKI